MKKIYGVLCVFIVLFSTAVSVNASEQKNVEKEDSMSASAEWVKTTGDKTITYLLTATETGSEQDKISLMIYTDGPEYFAGKSGQVQVKDSAFKIDAKLNSASLSQVKVKVSDSCTGKEEIITVSANWKGKGEFTKGNYQTFINDGKITKSSGTLLSREAIATGSINGKKLGTSYFAGMEKLSGKTEKQ
ncbi:MAG: hypothetical protein ACPK85_16100 [Methanosarcina sp.]